MRRYALVTATVLVSLAVAGPAYATVVHQLPGGTWTVLPDTTAGGSAAIVDGPGTPPAGTGSLRLTVASTADRALIGTDLGTLTSRPWSGLSGEYSTFVPAGGSQTFAPTLRFAGFQAGSQNFTTLSFEPRNNGTVTPGQWQTWTLGPDSLVWQTNATDGFCQQAAPCALSTFVALYPAGVWGLAQLGLGSGVAGPAAGYADAVTLRDGDTVQFTDFDTPAASPSPSKPASKSPVPQLAATGSADVANLGLIGVSLAMLGTALLLGAGLVRRRAIGEGGAR